MSEQQIQISLADQCLHLLTPAGVTASWPISTALNGAGERNGSECTPCGWHRIRACIGADCASGSVFVGRRPTGEVYTPTLGEAYPQRDWILSRILWLSGQEPGVNRGGMVDTLRRFIYIHGCPDACPVGQAASHGCVRMHNADVMQLFDYVATGTAVWIQAAPLGTPGWRECRR